MLKVNFDTFYNLALESGMSVVRAKEMTKQLRQDMIDWPHLYESLDSCEWALDHGFIPGRTILYGDRFNEGSVDKYCPDWDYFMAHPMNNHFIIWINDKLTLKYMLNCDEFSWVMPEYYLYIENDGRYSYLMDAPEEIEKGQGFILDLLKKKGHLALKPSRGSGGKGFYDLKYADDCITANGELIPEGEFDEFRRALDGYLVTEFIEQSSQMSHVFDGSDCTLRIVLYKKPQLVKEAEPEYGCMHALGRFGSSRSNGASNISHGGLAVGINWETGTFQGTFKGNPDFWGVPGVEGFYEHPDTGVAVHGTKVPHWEMIKENLLKICRYLSSLDYFGMDVIITDDGFKICEINSAPSLGLGQFHSGKQVMDNQDARDFMAWKKRPTDMTLKQCFIKSLETDE